jgi:hypothetical protein
MPSVAVAESTQTIFLRHFANAGGIREGQMRHRYKSGLVFLVSVQLELSGFPVLVSLPAEAGQDCKICNETQWLENKKS